MRRTLTGRAKPTCANPPTALPPYPGRTHARRHRPTAHALTLVVSARATMTPSPRHEHRFKGRSSPAVRVAAGHRAAHRRPPLLAAAPGSFFRPLPVISHPLAPPLGHCEASLAAPAYSRAKSTPEQSSPRSPPSVSVVPPRRRRPRPQIHHQ
jgi:hypothetical protein